MAHRKRRVMQHIMADDSVRILKEYLPHEWVVREYNPDYGIDLVVEIFDYVDENRTICEALGEMFFVQLKSVKATVIESVKVYARGNVEKGPLQEDKSELSEIDVIKFSLDTDEILTVGSMGCGVLLLALFVGEILTVIVIWISWRVLAKMADRSPSQMEWTPWFIHYFSIRTA